MLTLTLKNIPEDLHTMLKESAEKNRRSLNSEIPARLERDLAAPTVDPKVHAKEMRSILTGYLRDGSLDGSQISRAMNAAENALAGNEHLVPSAAVFEIAEKSRLPAYDCEFIVLASVLAGTRKRQRAKSYFLR